MVGKTYTPKESLDIERITRHLMLLGSFINNVGLLYGKMGISIFFYKYARYSKKETYNKFSRALIEQIYEDISYETSFSFANGLCGVGWGITYLVGNGFVTGNLVDILSDIDDRIMETDPRRIKDSSIDNGLLGIILYYFKRREVEPNKLPFDTCYRTNLQTAIALILQNSNLSLEERKLGAAFLQNINTVQDKPFVTDWILYCFPQNDAKEEDVLTLPLGLKDGIAGLLLKRLQL